jgi:hypothetical protein
MLIRMLELASWLIIYLSCFISLSVDITGSPCHDCFSHLHYIITFNIYLHVVFIQRTPIYEHEGFAAYRLMYFTFFLSTIGQIDWHARAHLASRNIGPAPESSKSPNPFVCCAVVHRSILASTYFGMLGGTRRYAMLPNARPSGTMCQ